MRLSRCRVSWLASVCIGGAALSGCGDDAGSNLAALQDDEDDTVVDTTPPNTPAGLVVHDSPTNLVIEWAPNSEGDLAGYILEKSMDRGTTWSEFEFLVTDTFFEDDYASRADYRIRAADLVGNESARSETVTFLIPPGGGPKVPARPR